MGTVGDADVGMGFRVTNLKVKSHNSLTASLRLPVHGLPRGYRAPHRTSTFDLHWLRGYCVIRGFAVCPSPGPHIHDA